MVYKARQLGLNRIVALKMTLAGRFASEAEQARFRAEAEAAGRLDHSHIVPIYEVGQQDGQPFFSMGYVEGHSLKELLAEGPLPPRRSGELIKLIAEAVHYAHSMGVIHRDLKPGNVLVDGNGAPRVTDFGLAKRTDRDSGMTVTGEILGTPGFMPPEQAAGCVAEVGPAADVYSLGAMLYNLLTGRPPFQAATITETLRQVLEQDPVPPRQLNSEVPEELELICLKCLEKRPAERYASAAALAEDLNRALNGEPISISSPRLLNRLLRTLKRNRDDIEIRTWGRMLCEFAVIVPVAEFLVWGIGVRGFERPYAWAMLVRAGEFAALGGILWRFRRTWWIPQSGPARHMLSQWMSFVVACHLVVAVIMLTRWQTGVEATTGLFASYPYFAILSGMIWFTLASSFWGYLYIFGAAFFALSLVLPVTNRWAPIEFGLLWGACLWVTGRRLLRLAGESDTSGVAARYSGTSSRRLKQTDAAR
ncbi:MAG: serine/threonine protein kinase [Planctomycetaceae bacterium]|nr:serine/threonine protein kinase [Planctomycetaceae bacterium]